MTIAHRSQREEGDCSQSPNFHSLEHRSGGLPAEQDPDNVGSNPRELLGMAPTLTPIWTFLGLLKLPQPGFGLGDSTFLAHGRPPGRRDEVKGALFLPVDAGGVNGCHVGDIIIADYPVEHGGYERLGSVTRSHWGLCFIPDRENDPDGMHQALQDRWGHWRFA